MTRLHWRAMYGEGEWLDQFADDGTPNKYGDIDRARLVSFDLLDEAGGHEFSMGAARKDTLVYRRRSLINTASGVQTVCHLVAMLGQRNEIAFVSDETGAVGWLEAFGDAPYHGPELHPHEGELVG